MTQPSSNTPGAHDFQFNFDRWIEATRPAEELVLGIPGFAFGDLFQPAKLAELNALFWAEVSQARPDLATAFERYQPDDGPPIDKSNLLIDLAPWVSRFVAKLFGVTDEVSKYRALVEERKVLWEAKREVIKKRILKAGAGSAFRARVTDVAADEEALRISRGAIAELGRRAAPGEATLEGGAGEEREVAETLLAIFEIEDTARKAAKGGGASWTDELHARAAKLRQVLAASASEAVLAVARRQPSDECDLEVAEVAAEALEAWLIKRSRDAHDPAHHWPSLRAPKTLDFERLVKLRRPNAELPELFVGEADELRARDGFSLTDSRKRAPDIEQEVDYCLLCHDRDKDSCSKGLRDPKTQSIKKNAIGVSLPGCPLCEKISEMHAVRGRGDALAALAIICIDNPMLPGTGHRICNDCMKACIFQKQEPVNIPEVETSVLTDVLALPWGFEIYGFLTRWNPLNKARPYMQPYNGKKVLVVGLGPAGYTLSHHLSQEGFFVAAVDGLKLEPLPKAVTGGEDEAPRPVRDFSGLIENLGERIVLGFGGVSEYGITVRWDKNFLSVLYIGLARSQHFSAYGGVRFGGTVTLDDAWALGFDHVAIAAGAGRPTLIPMKNNLSKGIRKASDFLMALQLSGAFKRSSLANLEVRLPAIVIGGGLTAIDTATELIAYYPIQVEKTALRVALLIAERGESAIVELFDETERARIAEELAHAAEIRAERKLAEEEGRAPRFHHLIEAWGGVSIAYRKRLIDSPAYRLNHEEVEKSLEEGVRYLENLSPTEAILDDARAVSAMRFSRQKMTPEGKWVDTDESVDLPARTVLIAAGTQPNVTYEREIPGSFKFDSWGQYFLPHTAVRKSDGTLEVLPAPSAAAGFFTSYNDGAHAVSFFGDNHPHYAGSVVKAMASAKDAYPKVKALFQADIDRLALADAAARHEERRAFRASLDGEWRAVVHEVNRLTPTIVEVVVRARAAARKFEPGQFYRLQNFESSAPVLFDTSPVRLTMEGIALTGAWVNKEEGLLSLIALEMGTSTRLLASLSPGEPVVVMGPTGAPTEIPERETVLLAGGGLGNAVLFSIAKAFRARGSRVIYFAGYKKGEDLFKQEEIEVATDQVVWCTDSGASITPRRPGDVHFRGNIVEAITQYGRGELGEPLIKLREVHRIIAIGSDRMMRAVRDARHGVLQPMLDPRHVAIASINSPMQCMMKEICAQCLQRHVDPKTGKEQFVFTCMNQDQDLDAVDFDNLRARLSQTTVQEKVSNAYLDRLLAAAEIKRV